LAQPTKMIVGLGNPGADYLLNRHNIGFMALDVLADEINATAWQKKFKGALASGTLDGRALLLLKPMTYMNLSGEAVGEALRYYKLEPSDVIVIHDDIDLASGDVRVKQGGGHGGHNGLKSLDAHIGKEYWRVRLGVGHPGHKNEVSDYVLGNFAKADKEWLAPLLARIAAALPALLSNDATQFLKEIKKNDPTNAS